jgi:flagellar hook assembly protein FlgD
VTGVPGPGLSAAPAIAARPNPFARETVLTFSTSRAGAARIAVYDAAGRRVRDLGTERVGAGDHRRTWDGRDRSGAVVAAGTYFLRVDGPDGVRTEKVIRVR